MLNFGTILETAKETKPSAHLGKMRIEVGVKQWKKGGGFQLITYGNCDPPVRRFLALSAGSAGAERSHAGGSQPPPNAAGDPKVGSRTKPNSLKLAWDAGGLGGWEA